MNVLVTGGAGYLGSVIVRNLLGGGHAVRVLDCLLHGARGLEGLDGEAGFQMVEGDVRSKTAVEKALDGVDGVVHLAAIVGDPACARQPELAREVNRDASLRLFEAARRAGARRFLFASTCSNYGKMDDPAGYVTEESVLRPVSLYAETKVSVEQALLQASGGGGSPAVTLLRFATLYGLSPRMRFDLTVNEFTMELLTRGRLVVYGEEFWRPYLHLADAARAVRIVLESDAEKVAGQVFNVGSTAENYRKRQLVDMIRDALGGSLEIERVPKDEDPRDYRVSFEKIRDVLGFRTSLTVPDGIREVMEALRGDAFPDPHHPRYRN